MAAALYWYVSQTADSRTAATTGTRGNKNASDGLMLRMGVRRELGPGRDSIDVVWADRSREKTGEAESHEVESALDAHRKVKERMAAQEEKKSIESRPT